MVIDLEPFSAVGIVDPGDFHQLLVFEAGGVPKRPERLDNGVAADDQGDLRDGVLRL